MKKLVMLLIVGVFFIGCSMTGGNVPAKWQSTFPSVPLSERVGGEWTGGPPGTK